MRANIHKKNQDLFYIYIKLTAILRCNSLGIKEIIFVRIIKQLNIKIVPYPSIDGSMIPAWPLSVYICE